MILFLFLFLFLICKDESNFECAVFGVSLLMPLFFVFGFFFFFLLNSKNLDKKMLPNETN